jgi:hypothetical protein
VFSALTRVSVKPGFTRQGGGLPAQHCPQNVHIYAELLRALHALHT